MSGQETRVTRISDLNTLEIGGDACVVCIYGPVLGRKWSLSEEGGLLAIGRGPQNDIVLDLDNVSRRHAEFSFRDGRAYARDLGSTNGTFVNGGEVTKDTELHNGDHVKVGGAIFKFLTGGNVESLYHEEIYRMTIVDGLTQIHNKRYFLESLEREMARCSRFGRPLHLLMFDVDHFKNLNDTYGHIAGDAVLRDLAAIIDKSVRREEIFARYGGEEFAMVIPEVEAKKVATYAEKMRQMVADHHFVFEGQRMPVTISVGVAAMPAGCEDPQAFIKAADERLYAAKRSGRNRVVAA
jgi:two-component system, cell cycle response regulator